MDFEKSDENMLNNSFFISEHPTDNKLKAWEYGYKGGRTTTAGPENCASGDMCWGINFYDYDYTDDSLADDGEHQKSTNGIWILLQCTWIVISITLFEFLILAFI